MERCKHCRETKEKVQLLRKPKSNMNKSCCVFVVEGGRAKILKEDQMKSLCASDEIRKTISRRLG